MSPETFIILNCVTNVLCLGVGYWICHSGFTGVYQDIKTDLSYIKAWVTPAPAPPVVVTPSVPSA